MGSARGPRAVFGGPPKTSFHQLPAHCLEKLKMIRRVFGGPPNTAGQRPALPVSTTSFRLREKAFKTLASLRLGVVTLKFLGKVTAQETGWKPVPLTEAVYFGTN